MQLYTKPLFLYVATYVATYVRYVPSPIKIFACFSVFTHMKIRTGDFRHGILLPSCYAWVLVAMQIPIVMVTYVLECGY